MTMTTVTWVQDGSGNYEVSSIEHLKQLMNKGTLYTDAGSFPVDYWGSGTSYIQTTDLDLMGDSTNIKTIGNDTEIFSSDYDGGEFSISNWSYVDPNFGTASDCQNYVGLFGNMKCAIKNLRLNGIWTIQGFHNIAGFLVGHFFESNSNEPHGIWNIVCDFADGSIIDTNSTIASSSTYLGAVGGFLSGPYVHSVTLKGSVDFRPNTHGMSYAGGVAGQIYVRQTSSNIQNLATFPSDIQGQRVGGVAGYGYARDATTNMTNYINAMIGNVIGELDAGGVIGQLSTNNTSSLVENMINSMTGNVTTFTTGGIAGGIFSRFTNYNTNSYLMNYMTGNVSVSGGGFEGGLVGACSQTGTITNSINAMNGNVDNAMVDDISSFTVTATRNTNFGLTYTTDLYGTPTPLSSGVVYSTDFPDLPYVTLSATNPDSIVTEFDFIFGNINGNTSYNTYTHCVIHTGDIQGPLRVDFDVLETNTTEYTTFINYSTQTVLQNGLTIITIGLPQPLLTLTTRSVNVPVVISEVNGAIAYKITYESPSGGEITVVSDTTTLEHNIIGLEPETQYTIRLYADTGSGYELQEELTTTTLLNTASNYDVSDFTENGIIDLTSIPEGTVSNINEVMDEIFTTGDIVQVDLPTKSNVITSFINLGDTLSIKDINGVLLPFETTGGTGQDVNVVYSDDVTTEPIAYDETNNNITVESVVHNPGDNFVMNGLKATVLEY